MFSKSQFTVAAAAALSVLAAAHATRANAITTFSSAILAQSGSNLDKNGGTFLDAVNFDNSSRSPLINGVQFAAQGYSGGTLTGSNYTLTPSDLSSGKSGMDYGRDSGYSSTAAVYPLIDNAAVSMNSTDNFTLALNNLTAGTRYEIQMVFSANSTDVRGVTVSDVGSGGTSGVVLYGGGNGSNGPGPALITGIFTADASSQTYNLINGGGTDSYGVEFSGFTLQPAAALPEPATLGLLGAGATGLLLLKKRKLA